MTRLRPIIGLFAAIGLIAVIAGILTLVLPLATPASKPQGYEKSTDAGKQIESTDVDTLRRDMEVPTNYNLKVIAFGVRKPMTLENIPTSQVELTITMLNPYPKALGAIKNYSEVYAEWENYCKEIGFNECDENNIFAPDSYYVEITASEYRGLKALVKPADLKETVPDQVGNIAKITRNWVMFNGSKFLMSFYSIWSSPNAPPPPAEIQPPKQQGPAVSGTAILKFDDEAIGSLPKILEAGKTGRGTRSEWSVKQDPSAPTPPNVIAQTADQAVDFHFPYVIIRGQNYKDVTLNVQFKAISGTLDQAAGIIFRFVDADNYYVLRANALENNVILFKYVKGARSGVASAQASVPKGTWHELKVAVKGDSIQGYLDGKKVIDVKDSTYTEGMIGLWTKADSVTYFDNFTIETQSAP